MIGNVSLFFEDIELEKLLSSGHQGKHRVGGGLRLKTGGRSARLHIQS